MNNDIKGKKSKIIVVGAIIVLATVFAVIAAMNSGYSEEELSESIEQSNYTKIVKVYNSIISGDREKEAKYDPEIERTIDGIIASWSSGDISEEEAVENLGELEAINSEHLSKCARKELAFIAVETEGDRLIRESETQFNNNDYYQALVNLAKIDESYSQYFYVEDFRRDCETILLALISSPTTKEEYAEYEERIDSYIAVDDAEAFRRRKAELEKDREIFLDAAPILESARADFEAEEYSSAFKKLEDGLNILPKNKFLTETLDEYHNVYVVGVSQDAYDLTRKKQYKEALNVVDEAISIYECDSLNDIRTYIRECRNPALKAKNNVVDSIKSLKDKIVSGEVDVESAKKEAGEYVTKSGKKFALGDYYDEEVTLLSMSADVTTSIIGVDMAADVRDLSYDITHWGEDEYFVVRLATDAVALVPVIGAVKYLKYSKELGKGAKKGAKATKQLLGGSTKAAKKVDAVIENSASITKNAEQSAVVTKVSLSHIEEERLLKEVSKIKKGLKYTSADDVANYARKYKQLPPNYIKKTEAKRMGVPEGRNPSHYIEGESGKNAQIGGDTYSNYDGKLPRNNNYIECDVDYGGGELRGKKRLVFTEDYSRAYYTTDHYETFKRVY